MAVLHILTDQEVEAGMWNQGPNSIFKDFPLITYFCQPDSMSQRSSQPPRIATPTGNQVLKTWVRGRNFTFRLKHCLKPVKSNQALWLSAQLIQVTLSLGSFYPLLAWPLRGRIHFLTGFSTELLAQGWLPWCEQQLQKPALLCALPQIFTYLLEKADPRNHLLHDLLAHQ